MTITAILGFHSHGLDTFMASNGFLPSRKAPHKANHKVSPNYFGFEAILYLSGCIDINMHEIAMRLHAESIWRLPDEEQIARHSKFSNYRAYGAHQPTYTWRHLLYKMPFSFEPYISGEVDRYITADTSKSTYFLYIINTGKEQFETWTKRSSGNHHGRFVPHIFHDGHQHPYEYSRPDFELASSYDLNNLPDPFKYVEETEAVCRRINYQAIDQAKYQDSPKDI